MVSTSSLSGPLTLMRKLRIEQGKSLRRVAKEVGMSHGDLSKIERGLMEPYLIQAYKIKCYLGYEGNAMDLFQEVPDDE